MLRRLRRAPVSIRDEKPDGWTPADEARHLAARGKWATWAAFWVLGSVGTALGSATIPLDSTLWFWTLAALFSVPLGLWAGLSLPALARRREEELASRRLKWGASVFLSLVGMAVWSGLFGYLNSALDFRPPQNQSFRVESNSGGQTRAGGFRRLLLRRGTKQILLQSGGPRWDKVRAGQTLSLPVGRGALGVAWLDAR